MNTHGPFTPQESRKRPKPTSPTAITAANNKPSASMRSFKDEAKPDPSEFAIDQLRGLTTLYVSVGKSGTAEAHTASLFRLLRKCVSTAVGSAEHMPKSGAIDKGQKEYGVKHIYPNSSIVPLVRNTPGNSFTSGGASSTESAPGLCGKCTICCRKNAEVSSNRRLQGADLVGCHRQMATKMRIALSKSFGCCVQVCTEMEFNMLLNQCKHRDGQPRP